MSGPGGFTSEADSKAWSALDDATIKSKVQRYKNGYADGEANLRERIAKALREWAGRIEKDIGPAPLGDDWKNDYRWTIQANTASTCRDLADLIGAGTFPPPERKGEP